jgi:hypothetical protein
MRIVEHTISLRDRSQPEPKEEVEEEPKP